MNRKLAAAWLEQRSGAVFCALLAIESLLLLALCRHGRVAGGLDQFLLGIGELQRGDRITSTFLPIGYAAPAGWAARLSTALHLPMDYGPLCVAAATMLALVTLARQYLRSTCCSATAATAGALLLGCNPRLLYHVTQFDDTNLTALALVAILFTLIMFRQSTGPSWALFSGLALGGAVLARPNLVLMLLLYLLPVRQQPSKLKINRLAQMLGTAVLLYAGVTAAAHGRPFFPHNGPYNLFVGNNEFTAAALRSENNGESSIKPAMWARGYHVRVKWKEQPDLPNHDDARDQRYGPVYIHQTLIFALHHPGEVLRLAALKLYAFFYEEIGNAFGRPPLWVAVALAVKFLAVAIIPMWLLLWLITRARHSSAHTEAPCNSDPDWIVPCMALLYLLPFVITNSDARFRPPLEALLLLDSCRLLCARRRHLKSAHLEARH